MSNVGVCASVLLLNVKRWGCSEDWDLCVAYKPAVCVQMHGSNVGYVRPALPISVLIFA